MVLIDNLSDAADQVTNLQLYDGSIATLELIYLGTIQRWMFNISHPDFPGGSLNGQILCVHPNILRQWKKILPFGLAIISASGGDPVGIEDFASGQITLYVLDATDVQAVEETFFGAQA